MFQLAKFLFGEFCIFSIGKVWMIADVKCFVNDKTPKMTFFSRDSHLLPKPQNSIKSIISPYHNFHHHSHHTHTITNNITHNIMHIITLNITCNIIHSITNNSIYYTLHHTQHHTPSHTTSHTQTTTHTTMLLEQLLSFFSLFLKVELLEIYKDQKEEKEASSIGRKIS